MENNLTVRDVAEMFGVTPATIFRLERSKTIPAHSGVNESGAWVWDKNQIAMFLASSEWGRKMAENELTADELCALNDISMPTLYRRIARGELKKPTLARRVDAKGRMYGGVVKVWSVAK